MIVRRPHQGDAAFCGLAFMYASITGVSVQKALGLTKPRARKR